MNNPTGKFKPYERRILKTSYHVALLGIAWGASMTASAIILANYPGPKLPIGIAALLINVIIGVLAIVAHMRWLSTVDEMLRQIFIETMALASGVILVACGGLIILEKAEIHYVTSVAIALLTVIAGIGSLVAGIRMSVSR